MFRTAISGPTRFAASNFLKRSQPFSVSRLAFTTSQPTRDLQDTTDNVKSFDELPGPGNVENFVHFMRKGGIKYLNDIQKEKFQTFGPIFRESFLGEQCVHICDADAIATVTRTEGKFPSRGFDSAAKPLVGDMPIFVIGNTDYEAWKSARSPIAPIFLRPVEIKKFAPGVNAVAKDAVKRLQGELKNGMIANLKHEVDGYTTENILLLIYDERMGFHKTPQNPKILEFMQAAYDFNDSMLKLVGGGKFKLWEYIATPAYKKFWVLKDKLSSLGDEFAEIRERKQAESDHICLYDKITNEEGKKHFINGIAITLSQLGVETTSFSLLWCLYHLSRNHQAQQKAYNEIVDAIGTRNDDKSTENPQFHAHLPYLKACIKESMRLRQIALSHTRVLPNETVLCGYKIPANTLVSLWHSHLSESPKHFESPKGFKPERWQRDESHEKINPFAYIPFGFGVRMCLGRRFAELELVIGLAHILQNFRLEYTEKEELKGVFTGAGFLIPEKELPIKFTDRV